MRSAADKRTRRLDLLAYLIGLGFGIGVLLASGYADWSGEAIGRGDFAKFWAGPRAVLLGLDPFDARVWPATALQLGATAVNWPDYGYFGWTIVMLLPFALLPLGIAFAVWTIGGCLAAAFAVYRLLRYALPGHPVAHTLVGMTLVASQPARLTVLLGQWGFVLTAALAAGIVWTRSGRPTRAGVVMTVLLAKPQLFVLAAPALAAWAWRNGQRRSIAVALVLGSALIGLSIALLPGWPAAWLRDIPSRALSVEPQTTTLATVLYGLAGPTGPWLALAVICAAGLVALAFDARGDAWPALWITLSIVAAPYVWSYDQTLLIVPLVLAGGVVARHSQRRATVVVSAGAFTLLVVSTGLAVVAARRGIESYSAAVPLVLFALIAIALWPSRRNAERPPSPGAADSAR